MAKPTTSDTIIAMENAAAIRPSVMPVSDQSCSACIRPQRMLATTCGAA